MKTHGDLICDSADGTAGSFVVDAAPLGKAERLPNGFLRAPANVTRAGVFVYRLADGTTRRELRPPEEVFAADSLASLELVPLVLEHPEPIGTPVTADNVRELSVGHLGDSHDRQGDLLAAKVLVTNADAIRGVETKERCEISLGYWRDLDATPGTWRGIAYDAVQRNIRYNHAAITRQGRAGPDVRIRLDAEAAVLVGDAAEQTTDPALGATMKIKITIDGIVHEIEASDSTGATLQKALADRDAKITALDSAVADAAKKLDAEKGRADSLQAEKAKLTKQVTDATDSEHVAELVAARLDLEREAEPLLNADRKDGEKIDVGKMKDAEIKRAVILLSDPKAKLDDVTADYLQARYDATCAFLAADSAARATAKKSREDTRRAASNPAGKVDVAKAARDRMIADTSNAWRKDVDEDKTAKG